MLSKNINKQSKITFVKNNNDLLFCCKIKCYCLGYLETPKITSVSPNEDSETENSGGNALKMRRLQEKTILQKKREVMMNLL